MRRHAVPGRRRGDLRVHPLRPLLGLALLGACLAICATAGAAAPQWRGIALERCDAGGAGFPQFAADPAVVGLEVTRVLRVCGRPDPSEPFPGRENSVTYFYGSCDESAPEGCLPPLQVLTIPQCEDPSRGGRPTDGLRGTGTMVAGAQTRTHGNEIALALPEASVTVFAATPELARRAESALVEMPRSLDIDRGDLVGRSAVPDARRALARAGGERVLAASALPIEQFPGAPLPAGCAG